ncbi:Signal recognition particle 72 kDa protein [Fukomys damarensis]|uniref:Signal recognition particle 72 kDa protein n=1 Tax=Fukomys damarensis TaxID=885580 RepID=A0A091CNG5_FUKDA|nr:Signal recognition particle 72 kDa protein [Fukomys damarensis]
MASGSGGCVSVPALWSEVNCFRKNGDFTLTVKTINKILQMNKDDVTALHCKVVYLIHNGSFKEALTVVNVHTKVLAKVSDGTEVEPQTELAIIHGQMAYILQLQGRTEEALQLYNQIIKLKPTDLGSLAVIANNIITINKDQNVFDSKKKLPSSAGKSSTQELLQEFSDHHPENAADIKLTMAQLKISQDPEKAKSLSKHLPSSDSMSLKVDVEALENSPGATYIRKNGGKVTGDSQPKEQGQGDLEKKKEKKRGNCLRIKTERLPQIQKDGCQCENVLTTEEEG